MLSPDQLSVQVRPTSSFQGRGKGVQILLKKKKAENKDQEVLLTVLIKQTLSKPCLVYRFL